jgi:5-methylcytosine-specific restriction protein A
MRIHFCHWPPCAFPAPGPAGNASSLSRFAPSRDHPHVGPAGRRLAASAQRSVAYGDPDTPLADAGDNGATEHAQPRLMPRAPRPCLSPGCPLPATHKGRCREHHLAARRKADAGRPTAYQRGYDAFWARTRAKYLAAHTRCECPDCDALPDHDRPLADDVHHRDGLGPLGPNGHDHHNLQALAHQHHSRVTAQQQPGGFALG